jgi:hypothetical protein
MSQAPDPDPTVADIQAAFRRHGVEAPVAFCAIVARRMIGFTAFTAFEPWQLCGVEEIEPLSRRWPSVRLQQDLIPFARHQGSDDLACFQLHRIGSATTIAGIREVHYDLGPPVYVELGAEFADFWQWLHSTLDDVRFSVERGG